ncbi:LysR family transcriptional regulator [Streptomyces scopuliridis]|uniref:LysR family transcriptional regulator n=1 Tax=Streptomyces scopuliridis TaxID=452529 RepID=UPI0036C8BF65
MEIRVLRYFLTTVATGSVTKAAEVVRVAKPSLSRQLRSRGSWGDTLRPRRQADGPDGGQPALPSPGPRPCRPRGHRRVRSRCAGCRSRLRISVAGRPPPSPT